VSRAAARGAHGALLVAALALGACGRYAELAQKLDVTARIAGDTWVAAGASRLETRILLVGKPDANGAAPFQYTTISAPIHADGTAGSAVTALQGTWTEVGSGDVTLRVAHTYLMPDESDRGVLGRLGSRRSDAARTLHVTVARAGGRLTVGGDPGLAGTYVGLTEALRNLGTTTARDAACAYQVFSLAIQSSEARIIGFGGAGMTQYQRAETYVGSMGGTVRVSVSGTTTVSTVIDYAGFQDQGGIVVDGPQHTSSNWSGDGQMSGVMTFTLTPLPLDPASAVTITGTIDYGANAVQLTGGNPSGGFYVSRLDGGGTAQVSAVAPPDPSPPDCLALP
jgi:hypothetical protein